jgi:hypothetical protein
MKYTSEREKMFSIHKESDKSVFFMLTALLFSTLIKQLSCRKFIRSPYLPFAFFGPEIPAP